MSEIVIRYIERERASDINIKNEPFKLFGRMLPCYQDGRWSFTTVENEKIGWDIFPDENYDYEKMKQDHIFIGAYDGSACIGLAILQKQWHKYIYLYDLKVNRSYRGGHIATKMIDTACAYAKEQGYRGVWTIGQDNNLAACLFYVKNGFRIGGLDTNIYIGTSQEGKADIYFYKDAK
ncbi:MAG: GNAT family N-acetyltransferase [Lachnospiraceae bacterium]|nr:GNAT family N-acetyltransferase [Lachnospiraceae bacterium]